MKVLKFGGTSVGTVESLRNVKNIVDSLEEPGVVVVSALGGLTDQLIATAYLAETANPKFKENIVAIRERHFEIIDNLVSKDRVEKVREKIEPLLSELEDIYTGVSLLRDLSEKSLNRIVSFGERMSSLIVANIVSNAEHVDSLSIIKTEKWFNKNIAARQITDSNIIAGLKLPLKKTIIAGGFISTDKDTGEITNLGRGGSDYTAALIAAALNAESLEIWTDVDGFMTADPRIIPSASVIQNMTFIESMELCSFGAKVIYPPTIYPVFHKNIPIKILNTHNPHASGTLITDDTSCVSEKVRGVSSIKNTALINVLGNYAANLAEINSRTYNALARNGINLSLVAANNADYNHDTTFSLALNSADATKAIDILKSEFAPELQNGKIIELQVESDLSVIAVVRESIKNIKGLGARLTNTLQRENITVKAISDGASETTIALIVRQSETERALRLVHNACF